MAYASMNTEYAPARIVIDTTAYSSEHIRIDNIQINTGCYDGGAVGVGATYTATCTITMQDVETVKIGSIVRIYFYLDDEWKEFGKFWVNSQPVLSGELMTLNCHGALGQQGDTAFWYPGMFYTNEETTIGNLLTGITEVSEMSTLEFDTDADISSFLARKITVPIKEESFAPSTEINYANNHGISKKEFLAGIAILFGGNVSERNGILYFVPKTPDASRERVIFTSDCYSDHTLSRESYGINAISIDYTPTRYIGYFDTDPSVTNWECQCYSGTDRKSRAMLVSQTDGLGADITYSQSIECDWIGYSAETEGLYCAMQSDLKYRTGEYIFIGYNENLYAGNIVDIEDANGNTVSFYIGEMTVEWDGGFTTRISCNCDVDVSTGTYNSGTQNTSTSSQTTFSAMNSHNNNTFANNTLSNVVNADEGFIGVLTSNEIFTEKLTTNDLFVKALSANSAFIDDAFIRNLVSNEGYISYLTSDEIFTTALTANAVFAEKLVANETFTEQLTADEGFIDKLSSSEGFIASLTSNEIFAEKIEADVANINTLNAESAIVKNIFSESIIGDEAVLNVLQTKVLDAETIKAATAEFGYMTSTEADLKYADITFANIDTANIDKANIGLLFNEVGLIDRATIVDGHVTGQLDAITVSANNITAGRLDAGVIEVVNLNAANITVGTINGQQISKGTINLDNLASDVTDKFADTEEDIASAVADAKQALLDAADAQSTADSAKKSVYATFGGNGDAKFYFKIATLKIVGNYCNNPITISAASRGFGYSTVEIMFQNSSETDPGLNYIKQNGKGAWYICKSDTSTWDLYYTKSEAWGYCEIIDYSKGTPDTRLTLTWNTSDVNVDLPSGATRATQMAGQATWCYNNNINYLDGGVIYANTVVADAIAAGAIVSDKIATDAITATKIKAGAISTDKIAANAITGDKIAANTITASSLAITDFSNYVDLNENTAEQYGFTVVQDDIESNNPWFQVKTLKRDTHLSLPVFDCYSGRKGDAYRIQFEVSSTAMASTANDGSTTPEYATVNIGFMCRKTDGTVTYPFPYGAKSDADGTVQVVDTTLTLSYDVTFSVCLQIVGFSSFSGTVKIRNVRVTRMTSGTSIVDGAITTDKIASNAITTGKIATGAITADKILAGSITATEIDVRNLFAQEIVASGSITGATLYGTYAEIVKGSVGGLTLSNERLEYKDRTTRLTIRTQTGSAGLSVINELGDSDYYISLESTGLHVTNGNIADETTVTSFDVEPEGANMLNPLILSMRYYGTDEFRVTKDGVTIINLPLEVATNDVPILFSDGAFYPMTNNTGTLGTSEHFWNRIYSTGATITNAVVSNLALKGGAEIYHPSGTPYIDFHHGAYGTETKDYTTRLIEEVSGTLKLYGSFNITKNLTPTTDGSSSLGTVSKQFASVYSENYYQNGVALENLYAVVSNGKNSTSGTGTWVQYSVSFGNVYQTAPLVSILPTTQFASENIRFVSFTMNSSNGYIGMTYEVYCQTSGFTYSTRWFVIGNIMQ